MLMKLGFFWEKNTVEIFIAQKKKSMLEFETGFQAFILL